jgi:dTDP-4-dehydrorhamnose 3,5-epimerase
MQTIPLDLPGVLLFEPRVFGDARGMFFESFSQRRFEDATGLRRGFVQDNHSVSRQGVLRGLHYQLPPYAQGKLVRVVVGAVYDVAVDIRRGSPSFGHWVGAELTAGNRRQLWIPEGFAHGFLALEDGTEFLYKTTNYYDTASERCIVWNEPTIGIDWPLTVAPIVSDKDQAGKSLAETEVFAFEG